MCTHRSLGSAAIWWRDCRVCYTSYVYAVFIREIFISSSGGLRLILRYAAARSRNYVVISTLICVCSSVFGGGVEENSFIFFSQISPRSNFTSFDSRLSLCHSTATLTTFWLIYLTCSIQECERREREFTSMFVWLQLTFSINHFHASPQRAEQTFIEVNDGLLISDDYGKFGVLATQSARERAPILKRESSEFLLFTRLSSHFIHVDHQKKQWKIYSFPVCRFHAVLNSKCGNKTISARVYFDLAGSPCRPDIINWILIESRTR